MQFQKLADSIERRTFIGGSDARTIMGDDETALLRLWREKRGEIEPEDLSANLIVQLGTATEPLNRHWYERNTGQVVTDVQRQLFHPVKRWMAATLDGIVEATGAVFEAKFMLPWTFSEEAAAEKHMPQLQHNMWVTASRTAVLSIITGGGKWVEMTIPADPLYQHLLLTAEKKFWRCVETGETPHLFGIVNGHRIPRRPTMGESGCAEGVTSEALAQLSVVPIRKTLRLRDRDHLNFVSAQPCLACGRNPSDAHHLKFAQGRALGRKVSDEFTVPLCRTHHRDLHRRGDERIWWQQLNVDPLRTASALWAQTHPALAGREAKPGKAAPFETYPSATSTITENGAQFDETKPIIAADIP